MNRSAAGSALQQTWGIRMRRNGWRRSGLVSGLAGDWGHAPMPADFDGDGKADPAVCKAATGEWRVRLSGSGYAEIRVTL